MRATAPTALILLSAQLFSATPARGVQLAGRPPLSTPQVKNISYDGLEFVRAFNAARDSVRLTLVFSPTCERCLQRAYELQQILEARPDADVRVFVLWSPRLPRDSKFAALTAARYLRDPRVRHFWDAWRFAVRHYTPRLSYPKGKEAWEIFVFYPPRAEWRESGPVPASWLQDARLDFGIRYDRATLGAELDKLLRAEEGFFDPRP